MPEGLLTWHPRNTMTWRDNGRQVSGRTAALRSDMARRPAWLSCSCQKRWCAARRSRRSLFRQRGRTLFSGDEDGAVFAWDLDAAKRLYNIPAHSGPVWSLAASRGSGAVLASGALI